ncbi:hypothetical protein FRC01_013196 [Tulasnella sp. 417]|nr:hypothetical protein FRC01_013196 [Tulasnella sp. 417]
MPTNRDINNVLPGELLCKIFQLYLDPKHAKRDRCRLSLVCRLWCQWVEDSALLWTNITAPDGLDSLRKSFRNSKEAPLELSYSGNSRRVCSMSIERFLQEASPHVARWRSLSVFPLVGPSNWEQAFGTLLKQSTPQLERLEIVGRRVDGAKIGITSITIGDGTFPNLTDVFLVDVPASLRATVGTALRSCVLDQIPHMSLRDIVSILENSPHLEELSVKRCAGLKMTSEIWSVHTIMLDKLVDVRLQDLDPLVIHTILSIIRVPNCDYLTIGCAIPDPPSPSILFNPSIGHLLLPFGQKGLELPLLDVLIDEDEGNEYLFVAVGYISINVQVDPPALAQLHNILRWIGSYSGPQGIYPVRLKFHDFLGLEQRVSTTRISVAPKIARFLQLAVSST